MTSRSRRLSGPADAPPQRESGVTVSQGGIKIAHSQGDIEAALSQRSIEIIHSQGVIEMAHTQGVIEMIRSWVRSQRTTMEGSR